MDITNQTILDNINKFGVFSTALPFYKSLLYMFFTSAVTSFMKPYISTEKICKKLDFISPQICQPLIPIIISAVFIVILRFDNVMPFIKIVLIFLILGCITPWVMPYFYKKEYCSRVEIEEDKCRFIYGIVVICVTMILIRIMVPNLFINI